ncbi:uncharacterized protein ACLA_047160 [Aspergillus clavatus NRRL 1]|uniref:C6 zinc finger domain protein n=1 Tax=Aspergillus clavatus (strain ATCC 1007 / CBS 513.65 / DSM 816 / NCTC 3887 / NRRL 1 / QM 1276 / 107) TaxID=344612 RepID=A1CH92_ASPCL|nr:C6 zinc finger domain protein [Aspergillus clavatus NRRL 1]EAW10247.1 C6 zinc finger domain protein [Aspergillus clavatus NRRL 1]
MRRVKKSRNGCARCKSKRVKCGEEKPHCNRCTRLGVKCPGYVQSLRWVTKFQQTDNELADNPEDSVTTPDQSTNRRSSTSPKQPVFVNASPPIPLASDTSDLSLNTPQESTESRNPEANVASVMCDNLWNLQGMGSLPELTDLCPPSPSTSPSISVPRPEDSMFNFGTPTNHTSFFSLAASALQDKQHHYPGFSPSSIVRRYPSSHPKPPPHDFSSVPQPLNNPSWTLIEYYFKEVAALFSSYGSQMNPFRSTVSRLWGSSLAMCKTMQSMAAATLVHDFPEFGPVGQRMRDEAVEIISKETIMDDKSLLALLMLGQTASWHDSRDLGVSFFNLLRKHLDAKVAETPCQNRGNNHQFFEEALIYWEMLLSFVADDSAVLSGKSASEMTESVVLQRVPHPWTGIARDTQFTVQEVGRLVCSERKRVRCRKFTSEADITQAQMAIVKAQELEERLLGLAHPTEGEIVSPGDDETPVWHLLTMAEVYRCTGLLQLYRVFPDLLRRRLPSHQTSPSQSGQQPATAAPRDLFFSLGTDPIMESMPWFSDAPLMQPESNTTSHPAGTTKEDPELYYCTWLVEFALTTLSRLKTIPFESRTRCLQPFLLVALSSELRLPQMTPSGPISDVDGPQLSSHAIEVSRTRRFILGRLTSFLHVLPPKPIGVCLQLVREVWRRLDAGESNVYWMDVMIEKGWETTMG